jgi:hypothetical protein
MPSGRANTINLCQQVPAVNHGSVFFMTCEDRFQGPAAPGGGATGEPAAGVPLPGICCGADSAGHNRFKG